MPDWESDKRWSDIFIPEIKSILGLYLINEAPIEEDAKRNTDLMELSLDGVRIGCRIRRFNAYGKYGDEFTIRRSRPSGQKTEFEKIVKEGWGDYFFYGFSNEEEKNLLAWTLARLDIFRAYILKYWKSHRKFPGIQKNNVDNSSAFIGFKWTDFPDDMVIAKGNAETNQWLIAYAMRMKELDPDSGFFKGY